MFWNLTFIFSGSHKKFSLVSLQITDYIHKPLKNVNKKAILFRILWYKVLVHWKLELLINFLIDSVLNSIISPLFWGYFVLCVCVFSTKLFLPIGGFQFVCIAFARCCHRWFLEVTIIRLTNKNDFIVQTAYFTVFWKENKKKKKKVN